MSVLVKDLIDDVRSLVGDENSSAYRHSDTVYRDKKIPAGMRLFNSYFFQRYEILGSGDSAYFSPDLTDKDKEMLLLCAAIATLRGEYAQAAVDAVAVSNPAGKTDLTKIPKAVGAVVQNYLSEVKRERLRRAQKKVEKEIAGKALKSTASGDTAEGLPIVTIVKTK